MIQEVCISSLKQFYLGIFMDTATLNFAKENKDPITGCIYQKPVELSECNHKVEGVFLKHLHSIENFTCPREGCDASSEKYTPLLMLQKNIQDWLERNPNAFPNNNKKLEEFLKEFIDRKSNEDDLLESIKKYQNSRNPEPAIAPRLPQRGIDGKLVCNILTLYLISIAIANIYFSLTKQPQ